jgi:hypothetical protein
MMDGRVGDFPNHSNDANVRSTHTIHIEERLIDLSEWLMRHCMSRETSSEMKDEHYRSNRLHMKLW